MIKKFKLNDISFSAKKMVMELGINILSCIHDDINYLISMLLMVEMKWLSNNKDNFETKE